MALSKTSSTKPVRDSRGRFTGEDSGTVPGTPIGTVAPLESPTPPVLESVDSPTSDSQPAPLGSTGPKKDARLKKKSKRRKTRRRTPPVRTAHQAIQQPDVKAKPAPPPPVPATVPFTCTECRKPHGKVRVDGTRSVPGAVVVLVAVEVANQNCSNPRCNGKVAAPRLGDKFGRLLSFFIAQGYVRSSATNGLLELTSAGDEVLSEFLETQKLPADLKTRLALA